MAIDSHYVTTRTLEPYFVDKDTGEPLAGGKVYFYKDDDRNTPKAVYELTGAPPNYTYTALPNPITLSMVGTIQNNGGDNVALYYLPFESDEDGAAQELYYVRVEDSLGNVQFTREAWPASGGGAGGGSGDVSEGTITNQISNPQFVDVLFDPTRTWSIAYSGATTTTVEVAPNWTLSITHIDAGTLTIARNAIAGSTNTITNPPYTLTITPGNNITDLKLVQTLSNNPDIWVPAVDGQMGYVAGGALLGVNTTMTMNYVPSNTAVNTQQIFQDTNAGAATAYFGSTVQLDPGENAQTGATGSVNIELVLSDTNASVISSIQVLGLENNDSNPVFRQDTVNRQKDHLFHYYNPLLQVKPDKSLIDGWDFPSNPHQFLGATVAASAIGANQSKYVWDQTIMFQSQDSGIGVTQNTTGGLVLTAAAAGNTRTAIIQYQEGLRARQILNSRLSVLVRAYASTSTVATISLWYTTDASLPDVSSGTNNSIVATLDANGKPATQNGTWTEVPRLPTSAGVGTEDARFTIGTSATLNYNDYGFAGWDLAGAAAVGTATFFAIVVGTADLAQTETISIESVSLIPGDIPARLSPLSLTESLVACQYYYRKSFPAGVTPAQNAGVAGTPVFVQTTAAGTASTIGATAYFHDPMRATPNVTTYNPSAANAQIKQLGGGAADWSATAAANIDSTGFDVVGTTPGGSAQGNACGVQWTADARLGIV